MAPSITGWMVEKGLYAGFRIRVRRLIKRGRFDDWTNEAVAELCLRRALT